MQVDPAVWKAWAEDYKAQRDEACEQARVLRAALERITATDCNDFAEDQARDKCLEVVNHVHHIAYEALAALEREESD